MNLRHGRSPVLVGLLAVILAAAVVLAVWRGWPTRNSDGSADVEQTASSAESTLAATATTEPAQVAISQGESQSVDMAATASASGCEVSPPSDRQPSGLSDNRWQDWIENDGVWLSPPAIYGGTFFGGGWYAGAPVYSLWVTDSTDEINVMAQDVDSPTSSAVDVAVPVESIASLPPYLRLPPTTRPEVRLLKLEFPSAGCWELAASSGGNEATFVVFVLPFADRPDVKLAEQTRAAVTPFAATDDCPITPWTGPEIPTGTEPYYWLGIEDDDTVVARHPTGVLYESRDVDANVMVWYADEASDLTISGQYRDDPSLTLRATVSQTVDATGETWTTQLVFPVAGCWDVTAQAGNQAATFTVYVYPADCRREWQDVSAALFQGRDIATPAGCTRPD